MTRMKKNTERRTQLRRHLLGKNPCRQVAPTGLSGIWIGQYTHIHKKQTPTERTSQIHRIVKLLFTFSKTSLVLQEATNRHKLALAKQLKMWKEERGEKVAEENQFEEKEWTLFPVCTRPSDWQRFHMKRKESKMSTWRKVCSVMNLNRNQINHHTKRLCSTVTKGQVGVGDVAAAGEAISSWGWRSLSFYAPPCPSHLCVPAASGSEWGCWHPHHLSPSWFDQSTCLSQSARKGKGTPLSTLHWQFTSLVCLSQAWELLGKHWTMSYNITSVHTMDCFKYG